VQPSTIVKDVLSTLERWTAEGLRAATATVVAIERSAPRDPGATLAVAEDGEVAGSVTGGCVEPAVYQEAREVLAGGAPRLKSYGIADEEAFEVGLSCGGTVRIFVSMLDPVLLDPFAAALADDRAVALTHAVSGPDAGAARLVFGDAEPEDEVDRRAQELLALGETALVEVDGEDVFVSSYAPRPALYVFGAVDHAAALAEVGRLLGYRVTVCDARSRFVTRERFADVDELVVDWPDRFLERAPVDERTVVCVLTHDEKFDVPALLAALGTPAAYIGAMGSRKTTADREERLRAAGLTDAEIGRIHAPIGLAIGARSPEEVAVAIGAEIVEATAAARRRATAGAVSVLG
jgi:xanthine dehydrogenase accessory factor